MTGKTGADGFDAPAETVGEALRLSSRFLKAQGIPDAARDCRILMADALGIAMDRLTLHTEDPLEPEVDRVFNAHVVRRLGREPVSRILGRRAFYGRTFSVTSYVLDPRPETEALIDLALEFPFSDLLDLGTGSGCIAITLLAERPEAVAIATDISPFALETAAENAATLGVADRIHFETSDWFQAVGGTYDLIVSNPPYIHPDEILDLAPEVEQCDPKIALFDTEDGLSAYRRIAAGARAHLATGGRLLVEIGHMQGEAVSEIFRAAGLEDVTVHPDLDGRDRVVSARG